MTSDPVMKKFVQFARVIKRLPGDETKGVAPPGEMAFDVPALDVYLRGFGNDPAEGTRLAVETLRGWLPDQAKLVITLDSDALN